MHTYISERLLETSPKCCRDQTLIYYILVGLKEIESVSIQKSKLSGDDTELSYKHIIIFLYKRYEI